MWQAKHPNSTNFQPKYQRPHRSLSRIDVHLFWVSLKRQFPVAGANKNKYYAPGKHPLGCSAATWLSNFFCISSIATETSARSFARWLSISFNLGWKKLQTKLLSSFHSTIDLPTRPYTHKTRRAFWAASLADFAKYLKRLAWQWNTKQLTWISTCPCVSEACPAASSAFPEPLQFGSFAKQNVTNIIKYLEYLYTPCKWREKENIKNLSSLFKYLI